MQYASGPITNTCEECGDDFASRDDLDRHEREECWGKDEVEEDEEFVPDVYIAVHNGKPSLFAIAENGIDLVEAYDTKDNGDPDWANAAICDPMSGGEAAFIKAAAELLRVIGRSNF